MWAYGGKLYCADSSKRSAQGNVVAIDWNGFVILTKREKNMDEYVREMREYDCC